MRRLERRPAILTGHRRSGSSGSHECVDRHDIDHVRRIQIRQDARQSFGEQGFADTRWPDHRKTVPTYGGNLDGTSTLTLSENIG